MACSSIYTSRHLRWPHRSTSAASLYFSIWVWCCLSTATTGFVINDDGFPIPQLRVGRNFSFPGNEFWLAFDIDSFFKIVCQHGVGNKAMYFFFQRCPISGYKTCPVFHRPARHQGRRLFLMRDRRLYTIPLFSGTFRHLRFCLFGATLWLLPHFGRFANWAVQRIKRNRFRGFTCNRHSRFRKSRD